MLPSSHKFTQTCALSLCVDQRRHSQSVAAASSALSLCCCCATQKGIAFLLDNNRGNHKSHTIRSTIYLGLDDILFTLSCVEYLWVGVFSSRDFSIQSQLRRTGPRNEGWSWLSCRGIVLFSHRDRCIQLMSRSDYMWPESEINL